MPIMYCCFFFLRCGLKCRRGKRLWKNVNWTKGTNSEGQVLDSFHQPTPSKNICPFAASICFRFRSFFFTFCSYQLSEILPVGGELVIICTPFEIKCAASEKTEFLWVNSGCFPLLLRYVREMNCSKGTAVPVGGEGRQALFSEKPFRLTV